MEASNEQMPRLMITSEVATYLKVSTATVYRLVRSKQIPASKVGWQLRFRRDKIDEWLSAKGRL